MSIQILCPMCGVVAEVHRPPVTDCAHCHALFPATLREATERALTRERAPMPLLLMLGQWGSLITGALFLVLIALAPFDLGNFSISGESVTGPEFLRRGGWLMGLIGAILLSVAVGLLRERSWARPLMLLYWLSLMLLSFIGDAGGVSEIVLSGVVMLTCTGVAAWYLFQKPNVKAYFESRSDDSARSGV
jgi:hypothetical protein